MIANFYRHEMRKQRQRNRIFKLFFIVSMYNIFYQMTLKSRVLNCSNSFEAAEKTATLMNMIFPDKDISPREFIHDRNEVSNEVIQEYESYKSLLSYCETAGVSRRTLEAFCNKELYEKSIFILPFDHFYYETYLGAILDYLNGITTIENMKSNFFEISLFTKGKKAANLCRFRKAMIKIELLINEILGKQIERQESLSSQSHNHHIRYN
ncbi:hypothetical protein EZS27_003904 [termite gut metagenome]|uniref:Uncharacterized protein n=1 Tax=termite gut metagenome TaxID=433724 RepID=A0A5J4STD2_9ZZZZ